MKYVVVFYLLFVLLFSGCAENVTVEPSSSPSISIAPTQIPETHTYTPVEDCDLKYSKEISIIEHNGYNYYVEDNMIYSENISTGKKQVVAEVSNEGWWIIAELYIDGNYLYYLEGENYRLVSHFFELRRINLDNMTSEKLTDCCEVWGDKTDSDLREVVFYKGKIYLRCNYELYCYDIVNGISEMIHNDIACFEIFNDELYYIEKVNRTFTIYKMNLETYTKEIVRGKGVESEKIENGLYGDVNYKFFVFIGDSMYFTTTDPVSLCRWDKDLQYSVYNCRIISTDEKINEFSLLHYDGKLYFVCSENQKYFLYMYSPLVDEFTRISEIPDMYYASDSFIKDGKFYYSSESSGLQRIQL